MAASSEKKKKIKHILIGSGIGTLAIGSFLLWYFKFRKGVHVSDPNNDLFHKLNDTNNTTNTVIEHIPNTNNNNLPPANTSFPLKKGSQGALVKQLQQALMTKYGKNILPKYGADGGFGTETITALTSKGLPSVIDQDTFTKIVSGNASSTSSNNANTPLPQNIEQPIDIAKNIWQNAKTKNLEGLISELQRISDVKDYVITNTLFKTLYLRGVRQTIVNASLSSFQDDASKEQIRNEFLRIGLKDNNGKWSLAGFEKKQVMTTQETTIHNMNGVVMEVPANTLLGTFIAGTEDATAFSTLDNETLYVPTKHVSHV
ncbi:MAG TPA: hypothetical protein VN698_06145 [Bacteroidia bacterium]|nr:hypothetical protein [Bacteroidia bacterium]